MTASTLHLSQNTISCILKAENKLKPKTIILGIGALITLLLGVLFSGVIDPIYAVVGAIVSGIILFDAILMNVYYAKGRIIDLPFFFKKFFKGYWIVVPLTLAVAFAVNMLMSSVTWLMLIVKIAITVITYAVFMIFVGLNNEEKNQIKKMIKRR